MIEQKTITIDGIEFQLNPMNLFTALKLDKKVVSMLLPIMGNLNDLDSEVDLGEMLETLGESLEKMSDADTEKFFTDMLTKVIAIVPGGTPVQLNRSTIESVFAGKLITLYKLVGEVMKYNKFTPFELLGAGGLTNVISGFASPTSAQKKSTGLSERLVNPGGV